jgi:hypothetical protein
MYFEFIPYLEWICVYLNLFPFTKCVEFQKQVSFKLGL